MFVFGVSFWTVFFEFPFGVFICRIFLNFLFLKCVLECLGVSFWSVFFLLDLGCFGVTDTTWGGGAVSWPPSAQRPPPSVGAPLLPRPRGGDGTRRVVLQQNPSNSSALQVLSPFEFAGNQTAFTTTVRPPLVWV